MALQVKLIYRLGLFIVCLGALVPLNVLYHQVRLSTKEILDSEASLISELHLFKGKLRNDRIALIESKSLPRLEKGRRLFLTQAVLAPVLVTRDRELKVKLINKEALSVPIPSPILQSTHYLLVEE